MNSNRKVSIFIMAFLIIGLFLINQNSMTHKKLEMIKYLYSLEGKSILIGQAAYPGGVGLSEFDTIKSKSGKELSILHMDYYNGKNVSAIKWINESNQYILKWSKKGGIILLSFHMINPVTKNDYRDTNITFKDLYSEGTFTNQQFNKELDNVVIGLEELKRNNVLVLIRPFHEMNIPPFWWGNRNETEFKKLWIYTHDYLVKKNKLNNLLFVYSPSAGSGKYLDYYISDYVDIVALDKYTPNPIIDFANGYNEIISTGKPFGFAEFSPYTSSTTNKNISYDSLLWLNAVKTNYPKASFMISYSWGWGLQNQANLSQMMNDPYILTLDEVKK